MEPLFLIATLAVLIFMSAFYASSEIAIISLTEPQLNEIKSRYPSIGKKIESHRMNTNRFLINISIANNFINILASSIATAAIIAFFPKYGVLIATFVMTSLILLFGEIIPKVIAIGYTPLIARHSARPLYLSSVVLLPIIKIFEMIVKVFAKDTAKGETVTEQSLRYYIKKGAEGGAINRKEREYISNIMNLDKLTVDSVMTTGDRVVNIDVKLKVADAIKLFAKSGHSRVPVYEDHPSNVVGILNVKDILGKKGTTSIRRFMRKPMVTPSIKNIDTLLIEFQRTANHLAIVTDTEGNYIGIVTLEDVLEEITGEIYDETDKKIAFTRRIGKKSFVIMGDFELRDFNKQFKTNLQGASSIKGYIVKELKDIPQRGDIVPIDKGTFEVLNVVDNKITKICYRKK